MSKADDRRYILAGMRETIWVESGGTQRLATRVPAVTGKAADDLVALYEHMNRDSVVGLLERFSLPARRTSSSKAQHFGRLLVKWALGLNDEAPTGLRVPGFAVTYADNELFWEGSEFDTAHKRVSGLNKRAGIFDRNPSIPSQESYLGETLGAPQLNPARKELPAEDLELFGAFGGYEDGQGNIVTYERSEAKHAAGTMLVAGEQVPYVVVHRKRHSPQVRRGRPPGVPNPED
jgi:hypothetical protein